MATKCSSAGCYVNFRYILTRIGRTKRSNSNINRYFDTKFIWVIPSTLNFNASLCQSRSTSGRSSTVLVERRFISIEAQTDWLAAVGIHKRSLEPPRFFCPFFTFFETIVWFVRTLIRPALPNFPICQRREYGRFPKNILGSVDRIDLSRNVCLTKSYWKIFIIFAQQPSIDSRQFDKLSLRL